MINYSGSQFQLSSATLTNNGTFNAQNSGDIASSGSAGNTFVNAGTFNKTGASAVAFAAVSLTNTSTFNLGNQGSIELNGGSTTTPITVPAGSALLFSRGTFTLNVGGVALGGAGEITLDDNNTGSKLSLGVASATVNNLNFIGGTLEALAGNVLTLGETFDWSAGNMTGSVVIAPGTTANLSGTGIKRMHDSITNNGTVNYTGTNFELSSATFNNPGTFNAINSGNIATSGSLGNAFNNSGTFTKSGASTVRFSDVPVTNTGNFGITGGTVILEGGSTTTAINVPAGAALTFAQATFTINVTGVALGGAGQINLSDDNNSGTLALGTASATINNLNLTDGTLNAASGTLTLGETFDWTGGSILGTVNITAPLATMSGAGTKRIFDTVTNSGAIAYSGSNFELSSATFINAGSFTMTGAGDIKSSGNSPNFFENNGTLTKNSTVPLTFNGITFSNAGSLIVNSGTVTLTTAITGGGSLTLAADTALSAPAITQGAVSVLGLLTLNGTNLRSTVKSLTLNGNGSVDIGRNALVIDYDGTSPLATLEPKLMSGRNNGAWNGIGIRSSNAASDPTTAIGFGEANAIGSPATYMNASLDQTALIFRHTKLGDANLSHNVDFNDLLTLAQNYGLSGRTWTHGNFNFSADGLVNFADLLILAQRYGQSAATSASIFQSSQRIGVQILKSDARVA